MISVKIISADCKKCRKLETLVRVVLEKQHIPAAVEKITDIQEMTK